MATADASRPAKTLPARSDVAAGDTWDLTSLFACDADWEAALAAWEARIPEFDAFTGTLGSSPERLAEVIQFDLDYDREGDRLGTYAFLRAAEDQQGQQAQRMVGRFQHVSTQAGERASFIRPRDSGDTLRHARRLAGDRHTRPLPADAQAAGAGAAPCAQ